jgi:hypothetical protein
LWRASSSFSLSSVFCNLVDLPRVEHASFHPLPGETESSGENRQKAVTLGTEDSYSGYRLKADEDITSIKIGSFTKLTRNPQRLILEQGEGGGKVHHSLQSCRQPRSVGKYQPMNQTETAIKIGQPITVIPSIQGRTSATCKAAISIPTQSK